MKTFRIRAFIFFICLACFWLGSGRADGQDFVEFDYRANFTPLKPTLVVKYEVAYRLFWMNLVHLADANVHATDGEWFNEATGEWLRAYLMVFCLDTLEEPDEVGTGRYSIHTRLATVVLKPSLEPLIFAKRDFLHVDTLFSKADIHNAEVFSVESGKYDYIKKDFVENVLTTNLSQFAGIVGQRREVLRFMKKISSVFAGETNNLPAGNDFNISVFTDNTLVSFKVNISPRLCNVGALNDRYAAVYFNAAPAPEFSGKGRPLEVWAASFPYMAEKINDPDLIWMSGRTFELGMIPLRAEFGMKVGAVRCSLAHISLEYDFDGDF